MEKEFKFFIARSSRSKPKEVIKKESELTEDDHTLLLGELIHMYESMPDRTRLGLQIYITALGFKKEIN